MMTHNDYYDADGTFKANEGATKDMIDSETSLEILQVVTERGLSLKSHEMDYVEFYAHCRDLWRQIEAKYRHTDFTLLNVGYWEVAELYVEMHWED